MTGADSPVMADEIFGPILPVLTVSSLDEAVSFVNARPKPLALYVFSSDTERAKSVLERTSSGGACVNDCIMHLVAPEIDLWRRGWERAGKGPFYLCKPERQ